MKVTISIARTELKTMFYSPIVWLILLLFAVQIHTNFVGSLSDTIRTLHYSSGHSRSGFTSMLFGNGSLYQSMNFGGAMGLLSYISGYLYLYIPLLTMGVLSREISSGSIKLLLSSPVSASQIVYGKFLAMLVFGLMMLSIVLISVGISIFGIKDLDLSYIFSGLLGLYLLLGAYSAIGLFISSLTSYQVIAALGTLTVLAAFNYAGTIGQDIDFVRDITFWISISGHIDKMLSGLITSEEILYFLVIIGVFLGFTIIHLEAGKNRKKELVWVKYVFITVAGIVIGYISSRPTLQLSFDATANKRITLTENSQNIVKKIDDDLKITTYINLFYKELDFVQPKNINIDKRRYEPYVRFKPDIELEYVYYWDTLKTNNFLLNYKTQWPDLPMHLVAKKAAEEAHLISFGRFIPPGEVRRKIDLRGEDDFVTVLERKNGQKTFLRVYNDILKYPSEQEISVALKKLIGKPPKVLFLTGHGERSIYNLGDKDYATAAAKKNYRYALTNQGFDVDTVNLSTHDIAADVDVLVIPDIISALSATEEQKLFNYIDRGGNILLAAEPERAVEMSPLMQYFGIHFMNKKVEQQHAEEASTLLLNDISSESKGKISYLLDSMHSSNVTVSMPEALGLIADSNVSKGFTTIPLLQVGDNKDVIHTGIALKRNIKNKEQKIIILGDADCFSEKELNFSGQGLRKEKNASNQQFFTALFHWFSNEDLPLDVRRSLSKDNQIFFTTRQLKPVKIILLWGVPALIGLFYLGIWLIRRKK